MVKTIEVNGVVYPTNYSKCIMIDGKHYRLRRGRLVEIPPEWKGTIPTRETIRQRKLMAKAKKNRQTR